VPRSSHHPISAAELKELIEQATVDCYNESEQVTGLFTMLEEHLSLPFQTTVLGASVTVTGIDVTSSDQIIATCQHNGHRQTIPILDLPLPTPKPNGWEWVEAYRRWLG
jgi:Calcium binding